MPVVAVLLIAKFGFLLLAGDYDYACDKGVHLSGAHPGSRLGYDFGFVIVTY